MIKTLSYASVHFSIAFTVTWILTGDAFIGGMVALIEPTINTIAYFFHERIWARVQTQKVKHEAQLEHSLSPAAF
ncbi:hypothetical protein TDB9533_01053 [Thalassocella blandensis]|nr:hypothetical protein TDB9533_01053 [Thalassocella blandensis]